MLNKILEYLASQFDGQNWGANGPLALTKVMNDVCQVDSADKMAPEKCLGVKIYPPEVFYKIPFRQWKDIFDESKAVQVADLLRDSIILHTWGRFSMNEPVVKDEHHQSAFLKIARMNCPVVFKHF